MYCYKSSKYTFIKKSLPGVTEIRFSCTSGQEESGSRPDLYIPIPSNPDTDPKGPSPLNNGYFSI